ncbi:MAG: citronellyl-CoA dehydrogenase [Glaciecola sp.]|jgi:citronellyl-CoA dehydrogenase
MPMTEEHQQFRALARDFVAKELTPHIPSWEQAGMMPLHEIFQSMAKIGLVGVEYSAEDGGQGADHLYTMILAEELGKCGNGSFPMAFGVQTDMATPSLAQFGTPEQKQAWLAPSLSGEMVASIAVTEPDAGSDVAGIKTRATRDGGDLILNGSKMYITNAIQGDWMCVLARTSDAGGYKGMSQIIVPNDTPGIEMSKLDKLGMRASDTALITFDDVRIPVENIIGDEGRGFQQQMQQFIVERMWGAYSGLGGCEEALARTKTYLKQREAFGSRLVDMQFIQYKMADLYADTDMLKVYNHQIAEAVVAGGDPTREATIAKLKIGRLTREVGEWCLQFHGGIGYMEETWTARFVRDNLLIGIGGGATEVMQQVIAMIDVLSD